jgi:small-conductance mechanosensitive channel
MDTLQIVLDTVVRSPLDSVKAGFLAQPWLQLEFLGNALRAYLYSTAFVLLGWMLILFLDRVVLRRILKLAERTDSTFDDFLILSLKRYGVPALYAAAFYLGVRDLAMREAVAKALQLGVYFWIAFNIVRLISGLIQAALERHMESRAESIVVAEQEKKSVRGILVFVKIVLWVLAFILVMDNLGVKVTTFVAGLGIGGIAIALAAQAILGDLFSYFVIFFDRPFQVGHFIKIGNFMGEVENIGIKTTRLRSLTGETIVMSNKYLTDNQVQNYRLMTRRRLSIAFEVEYSTTPAQLREIPQLVKGIVTDVGQVEGREDGKTVLTTFDRCHFKEFADSGLGYEIIFFVEAPEMATAMDLQQEINIRLKEALDTRKIGFAFPTRTLHMVSKGQEAKAAGESGGAAA